MAPVGKRVARERSKPSQLLGRRAVTAGTSLSLSGAPSGVLLRIRSKFLRGAPMGTPRLLACGRGRGSGRATSPRVPAGGGAKKIAPRK